MNKFQTALAAAGLALASSGANAALVTVTGDSVVFSFDDTGLASSNFGYFSYVSQIDATNFIIAGDTLEFSPRTFIAERDNKGITTTSDTTPLITITAKSSFALTSVALYEEGDYFRVEDSFGTGVAAKGEFYVDGWKQKINAGDLDKTNTFSEWFSGDANTSDWQIYAEADTTSSESATVKLQNILTAGLTSNPDAYAAFIEKKVVQFTAFTTPVPVPGAFWLFGSALTGVLVTRRRVAA